MHAEHKTNTHLDTQPPRQWKESSARGLMRVSCFDHFMNLRRCAVNLVSV